MYALSPRKMSIELGSTIGSWRVESELGRGAMAVVYKVTNAELGLTRALKVLERTDAETEARLLAEGRAQATIEHRAVIAVWDVLRTEDGRAALLMDWVDGRDLSELLQEGLMAEDRLLEIFGQILDGVEAAHERGLVHRDLKPGNVLVVQTESGWLAKVGDFGLVKDPSSEATATRAMLGTPRYMAPEQMRSARRIDARADIFALGCILYEMAAGKPAFQSSDLVDLYTAKSAGAFADPSILNPELSPEIRRAILGALQGGTTRRIPSCGSFRAVLHGAPWPPMGQADETMDDACISTWRCPTCSALCETEQCLACGGSTMLSARYQLVDLLSEGTRTRTYRALDLQCGRWVVCRGMALSEPEDVRSRFVLGAQTLASLDHPQLPEQLDSCFEEAGRIWEVREYIEGASLGETMMEERLGERQVLEILLDLVPVLAYLHERSPPVVHRVLTVDNVIRATDGRLVLIDFANVRERFVDPDVGGATFAGEFGAMAPEQYRGDASSSTDVYGLGTLAVALLSRQPLASLQSVGGLRWQDTIEASTAACTLLAALLAEDPAERPGVRDVGRRVTSIFVGGPVVERPPTGRVRRRNIFLVVFAGFLLAFLAMGAPLFGMFAMWTWGQVRTSQAWIAFSSGFVTHIAVRDEPADLANRMVPRANCDERPFTASVRIVDPNADRPVSLRFQADCTEQLVPLGSFQPIVWHQIELPSAGQIEATWLRQDCVSGMQATPCGVSADLPALVLELGEPWPTNQITVVDKSGAGIAGAGVGPADAPFRLLSDADGVAEFPIGGQREHGVHTLLSSVVVDGVSRHFTTTDPEWTVVVDLDAPVLRGTVRTAEGQPVPYARVKCESKLRMWRSLWLLTTNHPDFVNETWTDKNGQYGCSFVPDATSYERRITAPELGVTRHTGRTIEEIDGDAILETSRTVVVGCAGLEGDRCDPLGDQVVCKRADDPRGDDGDACQLVRANDGSTELRCFCVEGQDGVQAGPWATRLGPHDELWVDFRDVTGGVRGKVPVEWGECKINAYGGSDQRTVQVDGDGRYQLEALGGNRAWMLQVLCISPEIGVVQRIRWVDVGDDVLRVDFELSDES